MQRSKATELGSVETENVERELWKNKTLPARVRLGKSRKNPFGKNSGDERFI